MAEIGDELLEAVPGGKPGQRRIKPAEWPDPAFVDVGVRGDLGEFADAACLDVEDLDGRLRGRQVHRRRRRVMRRRHGDRRRASSSWARTSTGSTAEPTAPPAASRRRSPTACSARRSARTPSPGSAGGIALDGRFRPVVEFMYADFMWVAADQLFNQIGKARHMFGGDGAVPLVLRSKVAMGTGYGSQHSMDPAGIFATCAGLADRRAVHPLRLRRPDEHAPCACDDPVVVLEHVDLYGSTGPGCPSTTSTTACPSARPRSGARARGSRSSPTSP